MNLSPYPNLYRSTPLMTYQYSRYLPTAFDESMTLAQKTGQLIRELNKMGETNNELYENWNNVMSWIINKGLDESVGTKLNEIMQNGYDEMIAPYIASVDAVKAENLELNETIRLLTERVASLELKI